MNMSVSVGEPIIDLTDTSSPEPKSARILRLQGRLSELPGRDGELGSRLLVVREGIEAIKNHEPDQKDQAFDVLVHHVGRLLKNEQVSAARQLAIVALTIDEPITESAPASV